MFLFHLIISAEHNWIVIKFVQLYSNFKTDNVKQFLCYNPHHDIRIKLNNTCVIVLILKDITHFTFLNGVFEVWLQVLL